MIRRVLVALMVLANAASAAWSPAEMESKLNRLAKTRITADVSKLSGGDRQALDKLVEASRLLDALYLRQVWAGNVELQKKLQADKSKNGKLVWALFQNNVGPWSRLDKDAPFIDGVPSQKPAVAGFYPEDMTREEFESWVRGLSAADQEKAKGFFTLIRRDSEKKLAFVPYSAAYAEFLEPASKLLREAAKRTTNVSLRKFLEGRADAFQSDDYYASDVAWMDLNSPLEVTIGPYETYEDELFGYKAAFEAFVTIRNASETAKLEKFSSYLQELENNLPLDPQYRNPKIGALAPIAVVDQVFSAGDGRRGVMTAAFNLPNDERIVKEKGSKRVMLKNVQEAKFSKVLVPISRQVLSPADRKKVEFAPFFTHILMHELMHGLGPHQISVDGKGTTPRGELKELYSAIEEAKADITGLWAMQYLMDKKVIDPKMQESMYITYLASAFRSVRFGVNESHGRGVALQFNYLSELGAIVFDSKTGHFRIDSSKIREAVTKLTQTLLTIEAQGAYARAGELLKKYAVVGEPMRVALEKLSAVPVDISPVYPLAHE